MNQAPDQNQQDAFTLDLESDEPLANESAPACPLRGALGDGEICEACQ